MLQILVLAYYYRKKLTLRIALWPWKLLSVRPDEIRSVVTKLKNAEVDRFVFYVARVDEGRLDRAIEFAKDSSDRHVQLVDLLGLSYKEVEGDQFRVDLRGVLPSGEDFVWVCFVGDAEKARNDLADGEMRSYVEDLPKDAPCVVVWKNIDWYIKRPESIVKGDQVVIPASDEMTRLLLSRDPKRVFRKILARRLAGAKKSQAAE